ncbi:MAG: hypothetical protein AAB691_03715 [Patescibacteria group bacterium]
MLRTLIRAERGASLLDRKMPNWTEKVSLWNLRMGCDRRHVLGQLYGSSEAGYAGLGIVGTGQIIHEGFTADIRDFFPGLKLWCVWTTLIVSRRLLLFPRTIPI